MVRIAALTGVLVLASVGAGAQDRISTATKIRCTFSRVAVGAWKADAADASVKPATLVLRFEEIDADAGTAQLKTGSMGTEVTARAAEGYLHFMQSFRTGALYTTTVFDQGARAGRFRAVHSRHEYYAQALAGATSSPEQYYGECEAVR